MGDIKISVIVKGLGVAAKDQIGSYTFITADQVADAWSPADLVARAIERTGETVAAEVRRLGVPKAV